MGSGPAHGSPVCTVVAPVRTAGAVPELAAEAGLGGGGLADPAACVVAAPSTRSMPPPAGAGAACARSIAMPVARAIPSCVVFCADATDTVVASGVPVKNDCDAPGAIEKDCGVPAGGLTFTVTAAAVACSVTVPVARSMCAAVAAWPTSTVSSAPPPAPAPTRSSMVAPVSVDVEVTTPPLEVTLDVDGPTLPVTSEVTGAPLVCAATRSTTVDNGRPDDGSAGRVPRIPVRLDASALPGVTGVGRSARSALAGVDPPDGGATPTVATLASALAAGRPVALSEAETPLQAAPNATDVEKGDGNRAVGRWTHVCASDWELPGAVAVARWASACVGASSPLAVASTGAPAPAETPEAAAWSVRPSMVSCRPVPEEEIRYVVTAPAADGPDSGASDPAPPATPSTATAAPAIHLYLMAVPSLSLRRCRLRGCSHCSRSVSPPRCPSSAVVLRRGWNGARRRTFRFACHNRMHSVDRGVTRFHRSRIGGISGIRWCRPPPGGGTRQSVTTLDGAVDLARDRELVERCQAGDEGAFAELYDRYHRRLHRFCLRRLHSDDDAEEAVQEAFTRAWRALPRFGGDRRFYPWLSVIAGNVCTDTLRRRSRVVPMDQMPRQAVELDGEEVDEQLLRQVDLAMATEAFAHLSDRHQRVLRLRESTEWSAQRIAEFEGVAVPAVDTLLWRARQAFKREFATLADAGGLAGILGLGVAAFRRAIARAWLRASAYLPAPMRGPGVVAATVAITGAAIAGGSVALVGAGPTPHRIASAPVGAATAPSGNTIGGGGTASGNGAAGSGNATSGSGLRHAGATSAGGVGVPGTGASGLGGVVGGGVGTTGGAGTGTTTTLGKLISHLGGLVGASGSGATGSGSTTTSGGTVVTSVTGTGGGALSSVGTATSTTATTLPVTVPPTTTVTTPVGSATGTAGLGTTVTGATGAVTGTSGTLLGKL